jgi:hypothetical protein
MPKSLAVVVIAALLALTCAMGGVAVVNHATSLTANGSAPVPPIPPHNGSAPVPPIPPHAV